MAVTAATDMYTAHRCKSETLSHRDRSNEYVPRPTRRKIETPSHRYRSNGHVPHPPLQKRNHQPPSIAIRNHLPPLHIALWNFHKINPLPP